MQVRQLSLFEDIVGYCFKDKQLLFEALTHRSFSNEATKEVIDNQRLEFLGDSVLELIISEVLYERYPKSKEGWLTRKRAFLVCEERLAELSRQYKIGEFLILGKGERISHGAERISNLADAYESVVAAIYLDGGYGAAKSFVIKSFGLLLDEDDRSSSCKDPKSRLQELVQAQKGSEISYDLEGVDGPAHDQRFTFSVSINGEVKGKGVGRSKKEAQQAAAEKALSCIE